MWLLNVHSGELESFMGNDRPPYAILSHTWEGEEITFQQFSRRSENPDVNFKKIDGTCQQARKDGLDYVWIDTCCIDKTSTAELSEAVNSMFKWYNQADICYALLTDLAESPLAAEKGLNDWSLLDAIEKIDLSNPVQSTLSSISAAYQSGKQAPLVNAFAACKWFTRGWTLQELIAPVEMVFYGRNWRYITRRSRIVPILSHITKISEVVLAWPHGNFKDERELEKRFRPLFEGSPHAARMIKLRGCLDDCSVAQRFSWAASRQTTRSEDQAYSLLGLFDINMPLLYGEGSKAFARLQEEIMKDSSDQSILAWEYNKTHNAILWDQNQMSQPGPLLAPSPGYFAHASEIVWVRPSRPSQLSLSALGVSIELSKPSATRSQGLIVIDCTYRHTPNQRLMLLALSLDPTRFVTAAHIMRTRDGLQARRLILSDDNPVTIDRSTFLLARFRNPLQDIFRAHDLVEFSLDQTKHSITMLESIPPSGPALRTKTGWTHNLGLRVLGRDTCAIRICIAPHKSTSHLALIIVDIALRASLSSTFGCQLQPEIAFSTSEHQGPLSSLQNLRFEKFDVISGCCRWPLPRPTLYARLTRSPGRWTIELWTDRDPSSKERAMGSESISRP